MNTQLFHPAPKGLPVAIHPPRGSNEMLKILERLDWTNLTESGNADLLRAGALWLHGFLDESHSIAQGLASAEGSYWHALVHRSEGDFSNSKYWYGRIAVMQFSRTYWQRYTSSRPVPNQARSVCLDLEIGIHFSL